MITPRSDRAPSPFASHEGIAGSLLAGDTCTTLEELAFTKGATIFPGTAEALLDVNTTLLATLAPNLATTTFLDMYLAPRISLHVLATNDEALNRRVTILTLIVDGDALDARNGLLRHDVTAIRYCIDANPELEPDPATDKPAQNVTCIRESWTAHPSNVSSPADLVTDVHDRLNSWQNPQATAVNTWLGTAAEIGDIMRLSNQLILS